MTEVYATQGNIENLLPKADRVSVETKGGLFTGQYECYMNVKRYGWLVTSLPQWTPDEASSFEEASAEAKKALADGRWVKIRIR